MNLDLAVDINHMFVLWCCRFRAQSNQNWSFNLHVFVKQCWGLDDVVNTCRATVAAERHMNDSDAVRTHSLFKRRICLIIVSVTKAG